LRTIHSQVYVPSRLENYPALQNAGNPPAKFAIPMTMYRRFAILCFVLLLPLAPVLWWMIRKKAKWIRKIILILKSPLQVLPLIQDAPVSYGCTPKTAQLIAVIIKVDKILQTL
jgi:hypothetical protein